ncbi:MAG: hypothetical protein KJI72_01575, partial [Patescibacteria group bacterium]|nr:hypothetical protein [Patescibacteria group bacterium]
MFQKKLRVLTITLVLAVSVVSAPKALGVVSEIFSTGVGFEITTDNTGNLEISTQATTGGAIRITARQTGNAIFISTANNVGIGDTTPAALLTVGNGDLFQINSSGVVTAGTWQGTAITNTYVSDTITVGASGSVNDSALSANVSLLGTAIEKGEIANSGTLSF